MPFSILGCPLVLILMVGVFTAPEYLQRPLIFFQLVLFALQCVSLYSQIKQKDWQF